MRRDPSLKNTRAKSPGRSTPLRPSATLHHPRSALSCSRSQDTLLNLSELCEIPQARISTFFFHFWHFWGACFEILSYGIRESAAKPDLNINLSVSSDVWLQDDTFPWMAASMCYRFRRADKSGPKLTPESENTLFKRGFIWHKRPRSGFVLLPSYTGRGARLSELSGSCRPDVDTSFVRYATCQDSSREDRPLSSLSPFLPFFLCSCIIWLHRSTHGIW